MGAIVAYLGTSIGTVAAVKANRQAGQEALGQKIINRMNPARRNRLLDLLSDFVNELDGGNPKYDLRYEFTEGGSNAYRIVSVVEDPDDDTLLRCTLTDNNGTGVGNLRLKFSKDRHSKDATNLGDFEMGVVFPRDTDNGGFTYLGQVVNDLTGLTANKQTHYLAAFKFLSRCK